MNAKITYLIKYLTIIANDGQVFYYILYYLKGERIDKSLKINSITPFDFERPNVKYIYSLTLRENPDESFTIENQID